MEADSAQSNSRGFLIARYSGHVTYSAYPPPAKSAITSSPGFLEVTSLPTSVITPLHSSPNMSLAPGGGGYRPFF